MVNIELPRAIKDSETRSYSGMHPTRRRCQGIRMSTFGIDWLAAGSPCFWKYAEHIEGPYAMMRAIKRREAFCEIEK